MIAERVKYGSRGQGSLVRYKESPSWFSIVFVGGKESAESTKTSDLKRARSVHKKRLDDVAADRQHLKPFVTSAMQKVTVDQLLDALAADQRLRELKSAAGLVYHVKPLRAALGSRRAVDLTAADVTRYIEARQALGKANATINRETQQLGAAFALALTSKAVTSAPSIHHLPERNVRRVFFEKGEFETLVSHLPQPYADASRFAFACGWRKGEVSALKWTDVDTRAMTITLPDSKNGQGRTLALPEDLIAIIKRREQARLLTTKGGDVRIIDHVFHKAGKPLGDFRKVWRSACIKAGLFHVEKGPDGTAVQVHDRNFHDFRRSAVRNLRRAGVDETVAMSITGHKTASVFRRYNIVSDEDLRNAMQKRADYVRTLRDGS